MKMKTISLLVLSFVLAHVSFAHSKALTTPFVDSVVQPYLKIQEGLAGDDLEKSQSGATALLKALETAPDAEDAKATIEAFAKSAKSIESAEDIKAARATFQDLSKEFQSLVEHVGTSGKVMLYLAQCPMAFNGKGGTWVQGTEQVMNPYYGAMMLHCGSARPLE
jgi:Protein of unknown function (DUF3347).